METLLQENRAMGWPDVSQSLASPSRIKFAAKVAEFRRAALADPVAYRSRCEKEERNLAQRTVRKVNKMPVVVLPLSSKLLADAFDARKLREEKARALDQKVTDAFAAVRRGENPFAERNVSSDGPGFAGSSQPGSDLDARPGATPFRCAANSFSTSSRDDHKKASEQHAWAATSIGRNRGDNFAARADAHYAASAAHGKAADMTDDNMFAEFAGLAQVACNRCNQPSAGVLNKA